jgi:hypothetical protein
MNIISMERKKNWSQVSDGGMIPGLTVGNKITLTSNEVSTKKNPWPLVTQFGNLEGSECPLLEPTTKQ